MMNISVSSPVPDLRGASWPSAVASAVLRAARAIGNHYLALSRVSVHDIAVMRDVARSYEGSDPRLAAELYAAANRHEALRAS